VYSQGHTQKYKLIFFGGGLSQKSQHILIFYFLSEKTIHVNKNSERLAPGTPLWATILTVDTYKLYRL